MTSKGRGLMCRKVELIQKITKDLFDGCKVITMEELANRPTHEEELARRYSEFKTALSTATARMLDSHYFAVEVSGVEDSKLKERVYCYELYHQLRNSLAESFPFKLDGELDKKDHPDFDKKMIPDFVVHIPGRHEEGMNLVVIEVKQAIEFLDLKREHFTQRAKSNSVYNLGYCVSEAHYYRGILLIFSDIEYDLSDQAVKDQIAIVEEARKKYKNRIELLWHNGPTGGPQWLIQGQPEPPGIAREKRPS